MNVPLTTYAKAKDATHGSPRLDEAARLRIEEMQAAWQRGDDADVVELLRQEPTLQRCRSAVIELAVGQYRHHVKQGESVEINDFCEPFLDFGSTLHSSIFRQIEVQEIYDADPQLLKLDELLPWPHPGDQVGDFIVEEELGRGALARVFLCRELDMGKRSVVVKMTHRKTREAATLGKLQHENIVPVHSVSFDNVDELTCLCMPFMGRSTLHDVKSAVFLDGVPSKAESLCRAAKLFCQENDRYVSVPAAPRVFRGSYVDGVVYISTRIASALEFAHTEGIIHGDIKPSNILITPSGEPVVLDFNLSMDVTTDVSVPGGTLPYMSPEQVQSLLNQEPDSGACDDRSEVFSLGVVMYELLTGRLPFDTDKSMRNSPERLLQQQRAIPISIRRTNPLVNPSLDRLVLRCLSFDRNHRFESMAACTAALEKQRKAVPLVQRFVRQRRLALAATILVAVLLGMALSLAIANRAPYDVRLYRQGLALQERGKHLEAIDTYSNALSLVPGYDTARYQRAICYMKMHRWADAANDFSGLGRDANHAPSMAQAAYCYAKQRTSGHHSGAIIWYEKSLGAGLDTAELHNNIAVSYMRGKRAGNLVAIRQKQAQDHLLRAIQKDKDLLAARYNIAVAHGESRRNQSIISTDVALHHIRYYLDRIKDDPLAYQIGVSICRMLAKDDKRHLNDAVDMLLTAYKHQAGIPLYQLESGGGWEPIRNHPRYDEIEAAAKVPNSTAKRPPSPIVEFHFPDDPTSLQRRH